MANRTLTSANSTMTLVVPGIFPVPVQIQGYAVDKAFDVDAAETGETRMGVDGKLSAGFTPTPRKMNIHLQADSTSRDFFDIWNGFEKTAREKSSAFGEIILPGIGKSYTMLKGYLQTVKEIPDNNKVLEGTDYTIVWESITTANI